MTPARYRELAEKHFGGDYKNEMARYYRVTARAVNYWETSKGPSWAVANDLLQWDEPDGWKMRIKRRLDRELDEMIQEDCNRVEAYRAAIEWLRMRLEQAKERAAEERIRKRVVEDWSDSERQVQQHNLDESFSRLFDEKICFWSPPVNGPISPVGPLQAIALEYAAADAWPALKD